MKIYDVAVIGAGAAGLFCAGKVAESGKTVALLEKNEKVGRKLMITGKGRCNVTNMCDERELIASLTKNNKFMYSAFSAFNAYDTFDFFESRGVALKVERGNRVFPVSDKAVDIVDCLYAFVKENGVELICCEAKALECENGKIVSVVLDSGEKVYCKNVVVATGGKSYPRTGSTGDGYKFAKSQGHNIIKPVGSLVPINTAEGLAAECQGLSLKNTTVKVERVLDKKIVYKDFGEMLFTHFGLSGPMILSASAHIRDCDKYEYKIHIDLKPALDFEKLDKRILRDFSENSNKILSNSLSKLLPFKLIPAIIKYSGLSPALTVNQITKEQREKLVNSIKDFCFTVESLRSVEEAIITSGGVDCKEIEPKTMRSKKVDNLYFAGEVIDVDAYTGGFNLQIAFSTAFCAANSIIKGES